MQFTVNRPVKVVAVVCVCVCVWAVCSAVLPYTLLPTHSVTHYLFETTSSALNWEGWL